MDLEPQLCELEREAECSASDPTDSERDDVREQRPDGRQERARDPAAKRTQQGAQRPGEKRHRLTDEPDQRAGQLDGLPGQERDRRTDEPDRELSLELREPDEKLRDDITEPAEKRGQPDRTLSDQIRHRGAGNPTADSAQRCAEPVDDPRSDVAQVVERLGEIADLHRVERRAQLVAHERRELFDSR